MLAKCRQAGLSIVELMVSIMIALIILSGVLQVVLTSKQSFVSQDEMAFIQENARYALDVLSRDIQSAGHFGCAGANARMVLSIDEPALGVFVSPHAIEGFGPTQNLPYIDTDIIQKRRARELTERSDVLMVRRAGGVAVPVASHFETTINLAASSDPIENGSEADGVKAVPVAVVAEDCQRVGIFLAGIGGDNKTLQAAGHACAGGPLKSTITEEFICDANCGGPQCDNSGAISPSQLYLPGAMAYSYLNYAYYIGDTASGMPALIRAVMRGNGELEYQEIALGVEDFDVRYGVETAGQLQYLDAAQVAALDGADPWGQVRAVNLKVTFRSQAQSSPVQPGENAEIQDRYVREIIESTVRLRNKT